MLPDMTVRKSLYVGAGLFISAWIVPRIIGAALVSGLSDSVDGWGFLGLLALGILVAYWLHGMMIGASVLLPLATWIQSLNPGLKARRVMIVGLIVWAIPAAFVSPMLIKAAHGLWLMRYTQEDCRKGVQIDFVQMAANREGRLMVHGEGLNRSPLVLSHLKIALDGDPPRATPLECEPLRPVGTQGPEEKVGPSGPIRIGCFVTDPAEPIENVKATIVEVTCDGGR